MKLIWKVLSIYNSEIDEGVCCEMNQEGMLGTQVFQNLKTKLFSTVFAKI